MGTPFHERIAQTQGAGNLKSPRLVQLQNEAKSGKPDAVELFWQDVAKKQTPLVETIPDDNENLSVTFLWREKKDTRVIINADFPKSVQEMQLLRLPGSGNATAPVTKYRCLVQNLQHAQRRAVLLPVCSG